MAGWDLIQQMIDEGKRPLVRNDLWDEVRAATAERVNAYNLLAGGDWTARYRDAVNVRDPIGRTDAYQVSIASRVSMPAPWTTLSGEYAKWLKEEEGDAHPLYYFDGARGGDEYENNVFPEALGGGKTHWTHSLKDLTRMLPHADIWTDMAKVLNLLTVIRLTPTPGSSSYANEYHGAGEDADWATARAAAWNDLHPGSAAHYPYRSVYDWAYVGRIGSWTWPAEWKLCAYHCPYWQRTMDLSSIWNVEHLDASGCDPVRLIFFLAYERGYWEGDVNSPIVPIKIQLSGDGGTTWELLRELNAVNDGNEHWLKLASNDPTRWTANSVLRVSYNADMTTDTPMWTEGLFKYNENIRIIPASVTRCAEFDWDYKP